MALAKQVGLIVALLVVGYLLQLAASFMFFPDNAAVIDTLQAPATIYDTEPRLAIYERRPLGVPGRKIVFVGGSNVREGFRPAEVAADFPGVAVHNMAVGASEIRQFRELVRIALESTPPERRADLTFVLGFWYGSFVDEDMRRRTEKGDSGVVTEMLRYGLYRKEGQGAAPPFDTAVMPYAVMAIRPLILASWLYNRALLGWERVKALASHAAPVAATDERNTRMVDAAERQRALAQWVAYMGPPEHWSEDGLRILESLAAEISSTGARLVLVDLPLPAWHREGLPYDRMYQSRLPAYLARMTTLPGVSYFSLREGFEDGDFYDSAHPRPRVTARWAARLAALAGGRNAAPAALPAGQRPQP